MPPIDEIRDLIAALEALPAAHPLARLLRDAPDFRQEAALADALLHPQDRAYSVPQLFDFINGAGLTFGRWVKQAPYSPLCGVMARLPQASRIAALPPAEQYAAAELFRGTMASHSVIAYRDDRPGGSQQISFSGDAWLDYVPVRLPDTLCVQERLPPGAAAVLINRGHTFHDIYLPIDAQEKSVFDAIDGERSIGEIVGDAASRRPAARCSSGSGGTIRSCSTHHADVRVRGSSTVTHESERRGTPKPERRNGMRYMIASRQRAMLRVLTPLIIAIAGGSCADPTGESQEVQVGVANTSQADSLPSWNDSEPKRSILTFVQSVVDPNGPDYVPPESRIAVFDNDGTLWSEQPLYTQLAFALDRVKALAPEHPEWRTTQPFQAVLENDRDALGAAGVKGLLELVVATHAGMTSAEFDRTARDWFTTARHPRFNQPYTDLAYLPMVELLGYLRANGFKTYIVSGGGIEFMRAISEQIYGIPPEQVIGSSGKTKYEMRDGVPVIVRLPELDFFDDKEGKPLAIQKFIGRRPIAAFGNSDGDQQMLQWTAAGQGRRLMLLVDHTDAEREFEYRVSPMGRLELALEEAEQRGWTVVSMKDDWKRIFAFE